MTSSTLTVAPPIGTSSGTPFWSLVRLEAARVLRHPAPWAAAAGWLAVVVLVLRGEPRWPTAPYTEITAATALLGLGISVATTGVGVRGRIRLAEEAPLPEDRRALARLLGGLALVGPVAVLVALGALALRATGGVRMYIEPGTVTEANPSVPELLQPVAVAVVAVALGAVAGHLLRHVLPATVALVVVWFFAGPAYWTSNGPVLRWLTLVQVQPLDVWAAPPTTDPATLPDEWVLQAPGIYQDFWARITFSPGLAVGHDVYLVGLALVLAAVAVRGRTRGILLLAGALTAAAGVLVQAMVRL